MNIGLSCRYDIIQSLYKMLLHLHPDDGAVAGDQCPVLVDKTTTTVMRNTIKMCDVYSPNLWRANIWVKLACDLDGRE